MKNMKGSSHNFHIPEEIISDIVLQLPMKTLLRCKSVCKLWYKIIDDPKLVYMHSKKIKKSSGDDFLFETHAKDGYLPFFDLDKSTDTTLYLTSVPRRCFSNDRTTVFASCNGLLCLKDSEKKKFRLMNPLYSITDTYEVDVPSSLFTIEAYTGFGFDESSHKFKIVYFLGHDKIDFHGHGPVRLLVHEVGVPSSSSWRELSRSVGSWNVHFLYDQSSVFTDGWIHWLADIDDIMTEEAMHNSIVSFNLTTEDFVINGFGVERLLSKPGYVQRLLDFNGSLGVAVREYDQHGNYSRNSIRILVLCRDADDVIEDNNEQTTKKCLNNFFIKLNRAAYHDTVCILQTGHILVLDKSGQYFSYNMETDIITEVPESPSTIKLMRHQGSLIRPSNLASFCNSV